MLVNLVIGEFGFTYHVPETLTLFLADKLFRVHSIAVSVLPFSSPKRIHPLHNFILTLFSTAGMWMHFFFTNSVVWFVWLRLHVVLMMLLGLQSKLLKTEMEMVEFRQRYIKEKSRRMTLHNTLVVSINKWYLQWYFYVK